jgi:hypothetical protein
MQQLPNEIINEIGEYVGFNAQHDNKLRELHLELQENGKFYRNDCKGFDYMDW